jgi:outer membrane receptor protein involved in Fe transport
MIIHLDMDDVVADWKLAAEAIVKRSWHNYIERIPDEDWNKVKVLTQEFKFSSPAASSSAFKWTAGAYFFHQDNPTKQGLHFGEDAAMVGSPDINYSLINSTKTKSNGVALFAQGTYALTSKLNFTAGIRYDNEKNEQSILGEFINCYNDHKNSPNTHLAFINMSC